MTVSTETNIESEVQHRKNSNEQKSNVEVTNACEGKQTSKSEENGTKSKSLDEQFETVNNGIEQLKIIRDNDDAVTAAIAGGDDTEVLDDTALEENCKEQSDSSGSGEVVSNQANDTARPDAAATVFDPAQGQTAQDKHDGDVIEISKAAKAPIELPLPTLLYAEMTQVSRSIHYEDYKACLANQRFNTSKVTPKYKTLLPRDGQYVWFRGQSAEETADKHDWFGNVRCSFDLLKLLTSDTKLNIFSIDCAYFGYSSASRILLTYRKKFLQYKKMSLTSLKYGDPIMYSEGKLLFLRKDVSRDQSWWGSHQTELVIDARSLGGKRLLDMCDKYAVNHSCANRMAKRGSFMPHQCLIYNSSRRKQCPSPWTQEYTHNLLHPNTSPDTIESDDTNNDTQ